MKQYQHRLTGLTVQLVKFADNGVYLMNTRTSACFRMNCFDFEHYFVEVSRDARAMGY